jgi:hypothetical protein
MSLSPTRQQEIARLSPSVRAWAVALTKSVPQAEDMMSRIALGSGDDFAALRRAYHSIRGARPFTHRSNYAYLEARLMNHKHKPSTYRLPLGAHPKAPCRTTDLREVDKGDHLPSFG